MNAAVKITEPCPYCAGRGWRIVPPPPKHRGQRAGQGVGPTHGYEATYTSGGCRCDLCRAAHREGSRRRKQLRKSVQA